ncbi:hypothetical protein QTN24_12785 [Cupriavidus sp. SZY C1]|uniref:hypothetical protein n=1 Tax=Cupriavidus sp. SZY C1 TaxID=3055037 RepID=UPI0028B59515|nr:hypothetical protein [Cupriavidus sp. SZY C1]MDT6962376.1 hypothetical protein [Cupriavidus sp. SZY C1]
MTMKYQDIMELPKSQVDLALGSNLPETVANACLSIAHFEKDWKWVLERLCGVANDVSQLSSLRNLAVTCIGHVVRTNPTANTDIMRHILEQFANDPKISGAASDALDDLKIFGGRIDADNG